MLYTASNPEDETQHLLFHNQFISAVKYVVRKPYLSKSISIIFSALCTSYNSYDIILLIVGHSLWRINIFKIHGRKVTCNL